MTDEHSARVLLGWMLPGASNRSMAIFLGFGINSRSRPTCRFPHSIRIDGAGPSLYMRQPKDLEVKWYCRKRPAFDLIRTMFRITIQTCLWRASWIELKWVMG